MNPYPYSDYKRYLFAFIEKNDGRGAKSWLAEAAGCQRSFLSQVLNGNVHLTLEHALGIAKHLRLNPTETEYFYCLVAHARSGTATLRSYYSEKMKGLKWTAEGTKVGHEKPLDRTDVPSEYYSSWKFAAIHMATTAPGLRTTTAMARRLQLEITEVESILQRLKIWNLVEEKRREWFATANILHLPQDHFMTIPNHRNWRARSIELYEQNSERGILYSGLYSMSRTDFENLKEATTKFLAETRRMISESPEEELVCFTIDCLLL